MTVPPTKESGIVWQIGTRSWEHSIACAWRDGEKCTCKEDDENPAYGPGNPDWERDFEKDRPE